MKWTEFLTDEAERTFAVTARLLDMVEPDRLDWMPPTGMNWMTTGQLLKHISNACGEPCRGLVTGDWGLPPGTTLARGFDAARDHAIRGEPAQCDERDRGTRVAD
jgi:hypothetical protein